MVFSSLQFIFIFMPIFFGCYYIVPDKLKNSILFIGSLCFYFVGTIHNPEHFIVFILSIIADFVVGVGIEKFSAHKKVLLTIGISLHLISLAAFKYSGFVINEIGRLNPSFNFTADIVLPIGISFYTFQGISYIVDVYRGTTKAQQSLLKYTIYISMFEQLIAGCVFVTTYLNANVISDFRARRYMEYYNAAGTDYITGMKILPIQTSELKTLIRFDIKYPQIYKILDNAYNSSEAPKEWYEKNIIRETSCYGGQKLLI